MDKDDIHYIITSSSFFNKVLEALKVSSGVDLKDVGEQYNYDLEYLVDGLHNVFNDCLLQEKENSYEEGYEDGIKDSE